MNVGDIVEFELSNVDGLPRWDGDLDRGGNNKWARGTVISIEYATIQGTGFIPAHIKVSLADRSWTFLMAAIEQDWPGAPRLILPCECGADKAAGGSSRGAHSFWCPKFAMQYHT